MKELLIRAFQNTPRETLAKNLADMVTSPYIANRIIAGLPSIDNIDTEKVKQEFNYGNKEIVSIGIEYSKDNDNFFKEECAIVEIKSIRSYYVKESENVDTNKIYNEEDIYNIEGKYNNRDKEYQKEIKYYCVNRCTFIPEKYLKD